MKDFAGRIAVVTGGGSGMGRELIRQLVAEGCNIAMCDISEAGMAETRRLCETAGLRQGLRLTTHIADVSDSAQVERFRDEVANRHDTDRVHLLFNNAGIGGSGSMIAHTREEWERTFTSAGVASTTARVPSCPYSRGLTKVTSSIPAAPMASGPQSGRAFRTPPTAPPSLR